MTAKLAHSAVVNMLSRLWQAAPSGATLPTTKDKLERPCRLFRRNRRAAAAVEFALVAPVFFLLVFGMIEYGRMLMVQQVLTNASREGARAAVLDGATEAQVQATVTTYLTNGSISGALTTVAGPGGISLSNTEFGDPVTVTISIPFSQVSWLPSPMYLGAKTMQASTVMRREAAQ
jgi:hypothetical protein